MDDMGHIECVGLQGWDGNTATCGDFRGTLQSSLLPSVLASWHGEPPPDSDGEDDDDSENEVWLSSAGAEVCSMEDVADRLITRAEEKALGRELPWREIWDKDSDYVDKFREAARAESAKWERWDSIRPVPPAEAEKILTHPRQRKYVLKARCCYRDKNSGNTDESVSAKCHVVVMGCNHPDIWHQRRNSPTATRLGLMVLLQLLACGQQFSMDGKPHSGEGRWRLWLADAESAFLQGENQGQRNQLYMDVPADPIFKSSGETFFSKARLWEITGNVYGLVNAPWNFYQHVIKKMVREAKFVQHPLESCIVLRFVAGVLVAAVLIHVDDFASIASGSFDVSIVKNLFAWGSWKEVEIDGAPGTYKAQQIHIERNGCVAVGQAEFARTIRTAPISTARRAAEQALRPSERTEFKSVTGSVLHLAGHTRADLAAAVSLAQKGDLTLDELDQINEVAEFARCTADVSVRLKPLPPSGLLCVGFGDSSWANADGLKTQTGMALTLTTGDARRGLAPASLLEHASNRTKRVVRSTLAGEALAADNAADHTVFLAYYLSAALYQQKPGDGPPRIPTAVCTDCRSLCDAVNKTQPSITEKRTLIDVLSIQESLTSGGLHWIPTDKMLADGLTKVSATLTQALIEFMGDGTVQLSDGSV